jgi:hypothetical protein
MKPVRSRPGMPRPRENERMKYATIVMLAAPEVGYFVGLEK